jgi:hypothetical protein
MAFTITTVRMVVSMVNNQVRLVDHENNLEVTAPPFSAAATHIDIPWCSNQEDFDSNHFMTLYCDGCGNPIALWQSNDGYIHWSGDNQYHTNDQSGVIGGDYQGDPYSVGNGNDVVLIVDNLPWPRAILYSL